MTPNPYHMTDGELYIACSHHLSRLCDLLKSSHAAMAEIASRPENERIIRPMLKFSMYTSLEGVADVLNAIELHDEGSDSKEHPSLDAVFDELRRRFPQLSE